jgi:hypothetical protein
MKKVTSENILKLRELTDKLCSVNYGEEKEKLNKIKYILYENKKQIELNNTEKSKLKCYEELFDKIIDLITEKKTI